MSSFSDYLADEVIQITLRGQSWTPPTIYVALFTDVLPLADIESGILTSEVTITSSAYTRQTIAFDAPTIPGETQNTGLVEFTQATATWGNIRYAAIMDGDTEGADNVLYCGQLTQDKQINTNDVFKFNIGDLDLIVD